MRFVLDSSVALKWVLPEADSAKAVRLRDEYINAIHELLAPDIFASEIATGLASAERQKRIKTGESAIFLNDISQCGPGAASHFPVAHSGNGDRDFHKTSCLRLHLPGPGRSRGMRTCDSR